MADFLKTQDYLNNSNTPFEMSYMSANHFEALKRYNLKLIIAYLGYSVNL